MNALFDTLVFLPYLPPPYFLPYFLFLHFQLIRLEELVLTHTNNPDKRRAGRSTTKTSIDWTTISLVRIRILLFFTIALKDMCLFVWI